MKNSYINKNVFKHQYVLLLIVACTGIALSLILFTDAVSREEKQIQRAFNRASEDRVSSLQRGIEESLQELESLSAFYAASEYVARKEFHDFVQPFILHNPSIQALAWVPRVPDFRRTMYETDARKEGLKDFEISEQRSPGGSLTRAGNRKEYYPEYYYEPFTKNASVLGFDLATEPTRLAALEQARDSGRMAATGRLTLLQDTGAQFGVLVYQPIYIKGTMNDTPVKRRRNLAGFALGIFRIGDMMEKSLSYLKHQDIDIHLFDDTAGPGERFLYSYPPSLHGASPHKISDEKATLQNGLYFTKTITVAGREWTFLCTPTVQYVSGRRTIQPWGILGSGLLVTCFLSGYFLLIVKRTAQTQRFAEQLLKSKKDLEREAAVRAQAEQTSRESEQRYHSLFENMLEGYAYCKIIYEDGQPRDFIYLDANNAFEKLTGLKNVVGKKVTEVIPGIREDHPELFELYGRVAQTGKPERFEIYYEFFGGWLSIAVYSTEKGAFVAVFDNITERKQRERKLEAISVVSVALRSAVTRADQVPIILDQLSELLNVQGALLAIMVPSSGESRVELGRGVWKNLTGMRLTLGEGIIGRVLSSGGELSYAGDSALGDPLFDNPDIVEKLHAVSCIPLIAEKKTIGALILGWKAEIKNEDVQLLKAIGEIAAISIHRLDLHAQALRNVQHLSALHDIDVAISSSLDMRFTLKVLLGHVIRELGADAAAVLLLNQHTKTLTYAAGHGFRTLEIEQTRVRLGEGCAGRAALERRTISIPDAVAGHNMCPHVYMMKGEGFISHYVAPLIVKGKVMGVLEILNRSPLVVDGQWMDFFEALAGQAAIAIDNASLFRDLQHANDELVLAYDATIEGWSRALDLRDKETEGHSQRVTELTVTIARLLGTSEDDLIHVRRGALLHDIGKMGIPDSILLKPGKLSEEEWVIMRKHPVFARDLLLPIEFLQAAIDIPYYHHEKWDGTGYPLGLKSDQIPLVARVFSVVDVWDALGSDRPYRPAWPKEKMIKYMRDQTEKDFDPKVVEIFLKEIENL